MKSQIVLLLAIFAQPFLGFICPQVLTVAFFVSAIGVIGFKILHFRCSNLMELENIFLFFTLTFYFLKIIPIYGVLIPSGIIIGKYIVSKIEFKLISPKVTIGVVSLIALISLNKILDPNFTSFYIAIVLAFTDWTAGKKFYLFMGVLVAVVCVLIFKSRAFAFASFVFFAYLFIKTLIKTEIKLKLHLFPLLMLMAFVSLFLTFALTSDDGGVVYLYRETNLSKVLNPSFMEKVSNMADMDINRFRISRMWIQDEILTSPSKLMWGLNGSYEESIKQNLYYPAHNSFLEIVLYFGIFYFLLFFWTFVKVIGTSVKFDAVPILFIFSFGMVLHGVFSFTLIPLYFILSKANEYECGPNAKNRLPIV